MTGSGTRDDELQGEHIPFVMIYREAREAVQQYTRTYQPQPVASSELTKSGNPKKPWVPPSSVTTMAVYEALLESANNKTRVCYPKNDTLAERADVSVSSISSAVRVLREVGLLVVTSRAKQNLSNLYTVRYLPHPSQNSSGGVPESGRASARIRQGVSQNLAGPLPDSGYELEELELDEVELERAHYVRTASDEDPDNGQRAEDRELEPWELDHPVQLRPAQVAPAASKPAQAGSRPSGPASRRVPLPRGFAVSDAGRAFAAEFGLTDDEIEHEVKAFLADARAERRTHADWHAAWEKWILKVIRPGDNAPRAAHDFADRLERRKAAVDQHQRRASSLRPPVRPSTRSDRPTPAVVTDPRIAEIIAVAATAPDRPPSQTVENYLVLAADRRQRPDGIPDRLWSHLSGSLRPRILAAAREHASEPAAPAARRHIPTSVSPPPPSGS